MKWRFARDDEDGQIWMSAPKELHTFIEFQSRTTGDEWLTIMVVTRAWLQAQVDGVGWTSGVPGYTVLAGMLVIPDGTSEQLRQTIDRAVDRGGLEMFARVAYEGPDPFQE